MAHHYTVFNNKSVVVVSLLHLPEVPERPKRGSFVTIQSSYFDGYSACRPEKWLWASNQFMV